MKVSSVMFQRQRRGFEFEAFVPYSNVLASELIGCFANF